VSELPSSEDLDPQPGNDAPTTATPSSAKSPKTGPYVVTLSAELLAWAIPHLNGPAYAGRDQFTDPEQPHWHRLVTALSNAREVTQVANGTNEPRTYVENK
jgi:hypothetical protein